MEGKGNVFRDGRRWRERVNDGRGGGGERRHERVIVGGKWSYSGKRAAGWREVRNGDGKGRFRSCRRDDERRRKETTG